MKITNKYHLPEAIYQAACRNYKPKPDRISVTDLIEPPLIRQLEMQYWDELVEDVIDRLWAIRSGGIHNFLRNNAPPFSVVEEKHEQLWSVNGERVTLVGKVDLYVPRLVTDWSNINAFEPASVEDWKDTSVWSIVFLDRETIEGQLNCYAQFERRKNRPVDRLAGNYFLRDWNKRKASQGNGYPRLPFVRIPVKLWKEERIEAYIRNRIELHLNKAVECTFKERWEDTTTYAVMKKGKKAALRVLNSYENAWKWCLENNHTNTNDNKPELDSNISIDRRIGERKRCKNYCPVRKVCPYNKENKSGL